MTAVIYTATRNIQKLAFNVSGTDISASTTDDSINATSTDLSTLNNDEWIYVAGFTDSTNNLWHQLNAASTTTKILVDTNLVTEAAGDSVSIQGFLHGMDQTYSLDIGLNNYVEMDDLNRVMNKSLGGSVEILDFSTLNSDFSIKRQWDISLAPITSTNLPAVLEWLGSISLGETFTFDPEGSVATPDDPKTVKLLNPYTGRSGIQTFNQYGGISLSLIEA